MDGNIRKEKEICILGHHMETNDTDQTKTEKLGENISDKFKGLPMRELIGAPLFAAAEAQEKLASNISSKWFGVNVGISGKVTSSRENTRSTNQTAKYQVHVTASQQPRTEGLAKLMDIMASCIEPVPTSDKSGGE